MRLVTVPGVFRPISDSRLLARIAADRVRPSTTVLDPFTGSGILAIAAARAGAGAVSAADISRRAAACARVNARLNGVRVDVRRGDAFERFAGRRFGMIVANPPYVPAESDSVPRGAARAWDAGHDGRALIDRLCRWAPEALEPGGELLMIHSEVCDTDRSHELLRDGGLKPEILAVHRGPLGPLLSERAGLLEERGLLAPGQRTEEMVVIRAAQPAERLAPAPAGTDAP